MLRHAANVVKGYRTQDGAGVSLVRVLGDQTARDFDPFLMLDSFDSTNPDDYTAGFPLHPHRGIETVSYLREGAMHHRDTMGFEDTVTSGEVQWMCAGSGVEHEETIPAARRLLGVQLWLNLPAAEKMAQPTYHAVKRDDIESVPLDGAVLRLLAGRYVDENGKSHQGFVGSHLPLDYYELTVEAGHSVEIPVDEDRSVLAFTLEGPAAHRRPAAGREDRGQACGRGPRGHHRHRREALGGAAHELCCPARAHSMGRAHRDEQHCRAAASLPRPRRGDVHQGRRPEPVSRPLSSLPPSPPPFFSGY